MSAPLISVVIPAYNAASFIEQTLETVAAQTLRDFEVLVVDDGSRDAAKAVAEGFLARHGLRGQCLRQDNKGIAGARNTGVRAGSGAYIAFLDHDDIWFPEKLETTMAEFESHPEADLVCHNEEIVKDGKVVRVSRNGPAAGRMYERLLFLGNALSPSAVTLRRSKLLEVGGFRENLEFNTVEDYDLWMRLSRICRFRFLDRVLGRYQLVERGASNRIVYHHTNLEHLLRDHFLRYPRHGILTRLKMRRRLAAVYRSALGALIDRGEEPARQREYLAKMLRAYPLSPKNLARAALWMARGS